MCRMLLECALLSFLQYAQKDARCVVPKDTYFLPYAGYYNLGL
jgi:hypothetical protein